MTSEEEYLNHPKRVHDFIKASLKGWKYAMEHQEEINLDKLLHMLSMMKEVKLIEKNVDSYKHLYPGSSHKFL